ncbi:unnamed protein product [Pylaiella littoralis]
MVKYVRREIRTLTDEEREELFDAVRGLCTWNSNWLLLPLLHPASPLLRIQFPAFARTDLKHFSTLIIGVWIWYISWGQRSGVLVRVTGKLRATCCMDGCVQCKGCFASTAI